MRFIPIMPLRYSVRAASALLMLAIALSFIGLSDARAAGGGDGGGRDYDIDRRVANPAFDRGLAAIEQGQYAAALTALASARAQEPNNADIHNLIGFSHRKLGQHDAAAVAYDHALTLDPRHRGALAYQGELFLALDQLDRAKVNLDRLDGLCFFGCSEERELEAAIAAYEARSGTN